MTIQLIDQSDLEKQRFRCDVCKKEWIAPNRSYVEFHIHSDEQPKKVAGAIEVAPMETKPKKAKAAATEVVPTSPKRKVGRPKTRAVEPSSK